MKCRLWSLRAGSVVLAAAAAPPPPAPTAPRQNRLATASSPYLRQHAGNPVDWYPWGDEAFAKARREDKMVFLSIGYAACHWCHVMARESFADPAIAAYLDEHFVCIKVDREERPDVDELYLAAVVAMGQEGGWPLSVWMTPARQPFFGGTYFPPEDQAGRPAFRRVLERLVAVWRDRRDEVVGGADELARHLATTLAPVVVPGEPGAALLAGLLEHAAAGFDPEHGGFGEPPAFAPKFPPPGLLRALLRLPAPRALDLVQQTLRAMRNGGVYDQLGGGFHRYATDRAWQVPHFEKMLYDNAQLAVCYLEAFVRTGELDHARTARETLDCLLRDLRGGHGAFFASRDAQSEGIEGRHFVWRLDEVQALLGDDAAAAAAWFGITAAGNFAGQNVLTRAGAGEPGPGLERARERLLAARARRPLPAADDKVLGAWNGLALDAFATGYRVLGDERYRGAAREAAAFLLQHLVVEGRCRRSWRAGEVMAAGFLDDQAALANGLLSLAEIDGDARWLAAARTLLTTLVRDFGADDGGFWFSATADTGLLARSKNLIEGAAPSGTALATLALLRGGLLLGDEALYARGVAALCQAHSALAAAPAAVPGLVLALQFHLGPPQEVVVVGPLADARTQALLQRAYTAPGPVVVLHVDDGSREAMSKVTPIVAGKCMV
ncbi:MAG: thioredoxin domain-containing protein, partial [Planctomycetes bacterium]|nr:thioredoxin domain-containing protein [Planctomycetota bacterium]